MGEDEKED